MVRREHIAGLASNPPFPRDSHSCIAKRTWDTDQPAIRHADVSHQHRAPAATTEDAKFSFVVGNIRYCQFITMNKS